MNNVLREELELKINEEYYWTDSQVVLGYISNEAERFHVFVANCVQRIRETTDTRQWHHVDTGENPVDHASRGLKVADLVNSNWLSGHKFLWERKLATNQVTSEMLVGDPEVKITQVLKTESVRQFDIQGHLSRFPRWTIAFNVIARIQRLAKRIKTPEPLNVEERRQAALTQQDAFQEELNMLNQKAGNLPCNSQLYQLDPFLQDGIMRVGGRLRKASAPLELRHPVILPKDGAVTNLIIAHHHDKIQHQGRGQTLNELRANSYWIVSGSKSVAQYIRQSVRCRTVCALPEEQQIADLPSDMLT